MEGVQMTQMTGTAGHIPRRLIDVKEEVGGRMMEDAAENRREEGKMQVGEDEDGR